MPADDMEECAMKKLLCMLFALLLLTGCGGTEEAVFDVETLTPVTADLPVTPEGIWMELVEADSNDAVIRYTNETEREWEYGFHYWLHIRIDGQWYGMPRRTDTDVEYAFLDLAYILNPGESEEWTCEFRDWMYGALPIGHYRIVTDYGWVEFDVE